MQAAAGKPGPRIRRPRTAAAAVAVVAAARSRPDSSIPGNENVEE